MAWAALPLEWKVAPGTFQVGNSHFTPSSTTGEKRLCGETRSGRRWAGTVINRHRQKRHSATGMAEDNSPGYSDAENPKSLCHRGLLKDLNMKWSGRRVRDA